LQRRDELHAAIETFRVRRPRSDVRLADERRLLHVSLDPEALRNLLTRKLVIVPASTGELVRLELGNIDFDWLAELATRTLREFLNEV